MQFGKAPIFPLMPIFLLLPNFMTIRSRNYVDGVFSTGPGAHVVVGMHLMVHKEPFTRPHGI